jgi:anaerobic magnesium-protoporphyrin IX monomethyl ester cyclase
MRILLVNPPHPAIGSRIPDDHLPPLGLLSIGGPLIDAGHETRLLDAEFKKGSVQKNRPLSIAEIVREAMDQRPGAILIGHSGSTSGHPIAVEIARAMKSALPDARIVYGGVFPTYHWREVLEAEPAFDVVVRGEGEETAPRLIEALENGAPLSSVPGIAYRDGGRIHATAPATVIRALDDYRVGWELIDHRDYSYWGRKRAVVVQFSRGCPHPCNYCGQRGFWTRWRHRDPKKFAAELARLHREHGVEVINFADENPTASRRAWLAFLEALIAENVKLILVGSTRTGDIVRDADILHLYKKAGVARFLLGTESTDEATLALIKKGATSTIDKEAIRLLREHDILSMATYVVGFEEERDRDHWRALRQLLDYDPDQIQALYVTPHRWTPYYRLAMHRRVIQTDQRRWDYKHQVLATRHVPPWRVILWVKLLEVIMQMRPRALLRLLLHPDRGIREGIRWYYQMGRRVWFFEVKNFLFRDRRRANGPTVEAFWGPPQDAEEESMSPRPPRPAEARLRIVEDEAATG